MLAPLTSTLVAFAGLFWIAATLTRHERDVAGTPLSPPMRGALRTGGAALLAAAPLPWMSAVGAPMAITAWLFGALPMAGLAVVLALAYWPRAGAWLSGLAVFLRLADLVRAR